MEEQNKIEEKDLKKLYERVLNMRMAELFYEPYDPPEDLEELDE